MISLLLVLKRMRRIWNCYYRRIYIILNQFHLRLVNKIIGLNEGIEYVSESKSNIKNNNKKYVIEIIVDKYQNHQI